MIDDDTAAALRESAIRFHRADRDVSYERGVLDVAEALARIPATGYGRRVLERLDQVGDRHGDRFAEMELGELLGELAEEALDIGGWGLLTIERAATIVPEVQARRFRLKLLEAIAAAAQADQLVSEARTIIGAA